MRFLSGILLMAAAFAVARPAAAQPVTVIVNGQPMSFAQPPVERGGRVFVPLRGIFEQLGASVVYQNGQINATARGRTISLEVGSTQATVAGQPTTLDVAPFIVGATTFVPLRFISQALGASVNWNDSTSTVTISGRARSMAMAPAPPRPAPPPLPPRPRGIVLISQWPTGTVFSAPPAIRFALNRPVVLDSLRVWLDGNRVTRGLRQNGPAAFTVELSWPLPRGPHRVRVRGMSAAGVPFDLTWGFVTAGRS